MTRGELQSWRLRLQGRHTNRYDVRKWRKIKEYKKKNPPGGSKAWNAVSRALKRGDLKKEPCVVCGDPNVHAHHPNGYDNPLDVMWMCRSCHQREEGNNPTTLKIIGAAHGQRKAENADSGRVG